MDQARFEEGTRAFEQGDYPGAARSFLNALTGTDDAPAYHKAGNSLVHLRRYQDAVIVYRKALEETTYKQRSAVLVNAGVALVALKRPDEAIELFDEALADPEYTGRYKALQGAAGIYLQRGDAERAAQSYRQAAFDGQNPDAGKALNNLGLCYMTLGRPEDAVEAYQAAVNMSGYSGRGRACANLGLAFSALGLHEEAVHEFERAQQEFSHELSSAAAAACEASRAAFADEPEIVDGWRTGEMPPFDIAPKVAQISDVSQEPVTAFFARTDDEMRDTDRVQRRQERDRKHESRNPVAFAAVWVVVALVAIGALAFAWLSGFGYPTQAMTVNGLMKTHMSGKSVVDYWVAVPSADVTDEMGTLPVSIKSYKIDSIVRSAKTSKVQISITLEKGAPLDYQILLAREGVGWKVNGVSNDWRSTGGGS